MNTEKSTLEFLNEFYKKHKVGCKTLDISTDREIIEELLRRDLIFKTNDGYFISTVGREYLANLS